MAGSFARSAVSLSARWGRAAGRGSGGGGSSVPQRRRSAAHARPRRWGLKAGSRALLGSRRSPPAERRMGGGGGKTKHFPTPPPQGAAAATELLGLIQVRRVGARPSRSPQLLPQRLLPLPTPEPRPQPRASFYAASKRRRRHSERGQLRPCVTPPCVLWSRPRRREAWAAPAAPHSHPPCCCS